jgi:SAM-dependent methyltransferase
VAEQPESLAERFGAIDVYLFDQLLRGRVAPGMRVLDAGCGAGRNLVYLMRAGYEVAAVDSSRENVEAVRGLADRLAPDPARVQVACARVEDMPFPDAAFDVVVACAVLHFARDEAHFLAMLDELGRVLRPGGLLFARLASSIGMEDRIQPVGSGRFRLPDGTVRFLADERRLLAWTERLGGALQDPIKTTNVQGLRCMSTWVVRTRAPQGGGGGQSLA